MNPLLERQLKKHLPKELQSNTDLKAFLDVVNKSYNTSDERFKTLQRATELSSQELGESNKKLKKEAESQREVIEKLNNVIQTLNFYDVGEINNSESLDTIKLVDFIQDQTKTIIEFNKQKDVLLENLERQNQELNDYAHMVSHDLKSPLQSLDALTTWIKQDYYSDLGEGGKQIVNLIIENVEKMDTLIQGILQYSTIGKVEKKRFDVDLNILLEELVLTIDNPEDVEIILQEDMPIVYGDHYRLELLFYHLLQNSIKFSNKKKNSFIEINFTDEKEYWKFSIKDNGKGIEKEYYDKIFIAFQKLENDYKSTGIGLSIVKKIIETYKGEISVQSIPNVETIFTFTLKK